jgi:aminotransferase
MKTNRVKPDIRLITRMVPRDGNLVQGQSELAIDRDLAAAASEEIFASHNHYGPAEGGVPLRQTVAEKIRAFNGITVNPDAKPHELLITHGGTGALIAIAHTYLKEASTLVFEPYYPYHKRIAEELGGVTETFALDAETLELDIDGLRSRCRELVERRDAPLKAIIVCTPVNPTGKVFTRAELDAIGMICKEFDLLCISDEVYEHFVTGAVPHVSIATLPGMWERTITVNSFSKSWNISGWRLGYVYGHSSLVGPLFNVNNVFYVCSPTPLQNALGQVAMRSKDYYKELRDRFEHKRDRAAGELERLGFEIYDSGSAFYLWVKIPPGFGDAMELNERMMKEAGVAGVPGSAFADSDMWDNRMRLCIAREDDVLESALAKIAGFFKK